MFHKGIFIKCHLLHLKKNWQTLHSCLCFRKLILIYKSQISNRPEGAEILSSIQAGMMPFFELIILISETSTCLVHSEPLSSINWIHEWLNKLIVAGERVSFEVKRIWGQISISNPSFASPRQFLWTSVPTSVQQKFLCPVGKLWGLKERVFQA